MWTWCTVAVALKLFRQNLQFRCKVYQILNQTNDENDKISLFWSYLILLFQVAPVETAAVRKLWKIFCCSVENLWKNVLLLCRYYGKVFCKFGLKFLWKKCCAICLEFFKEKYFANLSKNFHGNFVANLFKIFMENILLICLKFMFFAVSLKYSLKVCALVLLLFIAFIAWGLRQLIFQAGLGLSVTFLNDTLKTVNCHINIDYVLMIRLSSWLIWKWISSII